VSQIIAVVQPEVLKKSKIPPRYLHLQGVLPLALRVTLSKGDSSGSAVLGTRLK
jgi:hypothetical protein